MPSKTLTIQHSEGVHTRPASIFVRSAAKFKSEVSLACNGTTVNGKSIMGLLMLALEPGSTVELIVKGADEDEALEALAEILTGKFE